MFDLTIQVNSYGVGVRDEYIKNQSVVAAGLDNIDEYGDSGENSVCILKDGRILFCSVHKDN